ncbi:hypothetical protein CONPUDRAFT_79258 [Coniophora puteana RWD-64-598 SS2]|uniref:RRM domain-containing protein n=1 Tax=Coniophora puteana (strain RWD-64-598) TaxID=741705 RepID=A0A5M3N728_CONPW|nr:uncharacterized protein CONPUDRAFT_79258 [Coniophora puteana RWD-64-598 SS2]EIW87088.1 hypothetical protein CONPUDRAFT_79258 [Coniophora puteana RWD-64-598 SS2]
MNRHHPYNQSFENSRRGGNSSGAFGPDRSHHRGGHRGGGRNVGRNRGGGSFNNTYDSSPSPYDQGPPPQGDSGPYNNYSNVQDPYYLNGGGYNAGPPDQYGGGAQDGYGQGYTGSFEDGPDGNYDDRGGYGTRPQQGKRNVRRERDDKVHDSIIEERIQRERPCRTLFIRNIKYETNSDDVRRSFEEHGDIKTFFDLISTRGMVFVTYFDLRAAERARDRLQGSEISGRPIDVHYSLPRDDGGKGGDKNQYQGTLIVTMRNSSSGQGIDDNEVRRRFQQIGDVKSVMPGDHPAQRYVEFYDIRACDIAFDRLNHQPLQDGMMEVTFAWEEQEVTGPATQRQPKFDGGGGRDWDDGHRGGGTHGRRGHRGGRGRGKGRGGSNSGGGGQNDGWDRRDDWGSGDRRRFEDDFRGGRGGRGGGGGGGGGGGSGGYGGDRFDSRNGSNGLPSGPGGPGGYGPPPGYGEPPSGPSGYSAPPPNAPAVPQPQAGPAGDRLEQARQVQQLLAALKQPISSNTPPMNTQPASLPPTTLGMPPLPPSQNGAGYYAPPPPSMASQPPYGAVPPGPGSAPAYGSLPPPPSSATLPSSLPPNILALLQQQTQGAPASGPPQAAPPPGHYGMPPPMMSPPPMSSMPPGGSPPTSGGYQSYMGYMPPKRS